MFLRFLTDEGPNDSVRLPPTTYATVRSLHDQQHPCIFHPYHPSTQIRSIAKREPGYLGSVRLGFRAAGGQLVSGMEYLPGRSPQLDNPVRQVL